MDNVGKVILARIMEKGYTTPEDSRRYARMLDASITHTYENVLASMEMRGSQDHALMNDYRARIARLRGTEQRRAA